MLLEIVFFSNNLRLYQICNPVFWLEIKFQSCFAHLRLEISLVLNIPYRTRRFFLFEYLILVIGIRYSLAVVIVLILF